jgi:hypothetical protein
MQHVGIVGLPVHKAMGLSIRTNLAARPDVADEMYQEIGRS